MILIPLYQKIKIGGQITEKLLLNTTTYKFINLIRLRFFLRLIFNRIT